MFSIADFGCKTSLLRQRVEGEEGKTDFVELFFDLVFVFAVTQISHTLLEHLTPTGALQAILVLMAVWWSWTFNVWVTNWIEPHWAVVRLMLFAMMLVGLVLSTSIPLAFGPRGLYFALAYVAMQVGRSLFMLWALRHHHDENFRNFQRIFAWTVASGAFWIAGGVSEGETRFILWVVALLFDYGGPATDYRTPGLGRSTEGAWVVDGGHLAERCGLFIIIALGESVLMIGAAFSNMEWTAGKFATFVASFAATVAMWGLYFNIGQEYAHNKIMAPSTQTGRIARFTYTYVHILLVAGIIVTAVADELVLAHPVGEMEMKTVLVVLGGPAIYLAGNLLFKMSVFGRAPASHFGGLAMLGLLALAASWLLPLTLAMGTTGTLTVVVLWEYVSLRRVRERLAREAQAGAEIG